MFSVIFFSSLCFPSLNNRPRLSSNTDRHWELAAREREREREKKRGMGERVKERMEEREREVDWRLVLRLLFLQYRYRPVTEKKRLF